MDRPPGRFSFRFVLAASSLCLAAPAMAQLTSSAINGTVRDATGAVLPGVGITAVHKDTGRNRVASSSPQGTYRLDGLVPGTYTLRAELAGFSVVERRGIVLVGTAVATVDFTLHVAGGAEAVDVVAEAPVVDLTQSQLKTQVDGAMIEELPINGRRFQDFTHLAPGVHIDFGSTRAGATDAISFFGFNERFKSLYVDGVDLNDELTGGGTGITDAPRAQFSMETVQEINVLRNQFSAEVGRQQAGVINVITRSGTNDLSGGAFLFFRDDALDKKNFFATGEIPFRQYQFGANLGGPIVKDKTHYFLNYERWDSEQVATIRVPPALVSYLPDPRAEIPVTYNRDNFFVKFSHSFSPAQFLNVTYLFDRQTADNQAAVANAAADSRFTERQRDHFAVARLTSTFGSGGVNEARLAYSYSFTRRPVASGRPNLNFAGFQSGTPTNMPQGRTQKNLIFSDVYTRHFSGKGDHALKIGGEINIVRLPTNLNLFQFGQFTFARQEPPGPANPPIQYILGRYAFDFADLNSDFYGIFVQDDWRISPRLTLNIGVRYDLEVYKGAYEGADYPPLGGEEERVRFLITTSPGQPNAGTIYKSRETDRNNVQPRVGFNWSATADGRTSVRGGWGIFTEGGHDPISVQGTLRGDRAQTFVAPGNIFPLLSFFPNEPPPQLLNTFFRISLVNQFPGVFVESAYAHQLTLGVERQVPGDVALALDYAAIRSRNNGRDVNVNHRGRDGRCPFLATCQAVTVNLANGRINSDAIQLQIRRSFARKVGFLASYTWLKAREDGPSTSPFLRDADYGPTPNDVRHHLVLTTNVRLPLDFNVGLIANVASAFPYNHTAGRDTTGDGVPGSDRPAGVTYNSLRGDGFFSTDVRLTKVFRFGGRARVELLGEIFNLFNTVNFNNYVGAQTSAFFMQPTQALAPLQAQLGARVRF